jgi:hypothetical protein
VTSEAEKRLAELQALLESRDPSPEVLAAASARVEAALRSLTRATPPSELARIVDLHAVVRETARARRSATGGELERVRDERARHARLTRPEDGASGVDVRA